VILKFTLPIGYPFESAPNFTIESRWLSAEDTERLIAELLQQFNQDPKRGIIAKWIAWLQTSTLSFLNIISEKPLNENKEEDEKIKPITIHNSILNDKKNRYQGHLFEVQSVDQIKKTIEEIKTNKKTADASSICYAFTIKTRHAIKGGSHDDKIKEAGNKIMEAIRTAQIDNILVVICVWTQSDETSEEHLKQIINQTKNIVQQYTKAIQEKKDQKESDDTKNKRKFRPAEDVLSRIQHDKSLTASDFMIGYEDRFLGIKEMTLPEFDKGDVPFHRIRYFKQNEEIMWDRRTKLDRLFFS